jgi:hypothetical protein
MLQLKNKIIAFVLLLIVAIPVFLSLEFLLKENIIQQEADAKMETIVLKSVRIPAAKLIWLRKGKEVLIDGKLFDIKSFKTENGLVTLLGFYDDKETKLLDEYKNITDNNTNNPLSELAFKFLFSTVYNSSFEMAYTANWHAVLNRYYSFDDMLPAAPTLAFIQPPRL